MEFENIYRGYVIREKCGNGFGMFIGPSSETYRVLPRSMAARFTKEEAVEYIKTGIFCKDDGEYVIEDVI